MYLGEDGQRVGGRWWRWTWRGRLGGFGLLLEWKCAVPVRRGERTGRRGGGTESGGAEDVGPGEGGGREISGGSDEIGSEPPGVSEAEVRRQVGAETLRGTTRRYPSSEPAGGRRKEGRGPRRVGALNAGRAGSRTRGARSGTGGGSPRSGPTRPVLQGAVRVRLSWRGCVSGLRSIRGFARGGLRSRTPVCGPGRARRPGQR